MTRAELIAAVRAHAARYYACGWDALVECWSDDEIARAVGRTRTAKGAIRKVAGALRIPVRIDAPYILSIHAEDGVHVRGFRDIASAFGEWQTQSGHKLNPVLGSAWNQHGRISVTDDWGRCITLRHNKYAR